MTKLPKPPAEVPLVRSLDRCAPKFADAVRALIATMEARGHDPMIAETLRTDARQQHLFNFGRKYDDGRGIVTNAANASRSWHGYGLAADLVSRSKGWGAPPSFWKALGAAAAQHGLTWGGTWKAKDLPHVQWGGCPVSPTGPQQALRALKNVEAVWRQVQAI